MNTSKTVTVELDIKRDTTIPVPQFVQGDTNIVEVSVKDNGVAADLSSVGRVVVNFRRQDGVIISRVITPNGNKLTYRLGAEEAELVGRGYVELQFYSVDNTERYSTSPFGIQIKPDIGTGEITDETGNLSLVQEIFVNIDDLKQKVAVLEQSPGGGGSVPSNVILFEDWTEGETVTIDTSTTPPADTTAPVLTISPNGGNFASTQGVTMTTNETATVYYTLDGSTPTTGSTQYSAPLTLSATTTLKVFARDMAGNSSAVQTVTFTKDVSAPADTTAPTVTASPAAGTYTSAQSVTLTANETSTIYYTTNGTTPTTASTVYSGPISISATTTLQFIARDTAGNQSTPVAATYTINLPDTTAPILTLTPAATFSDTQTVNMSANETATIWYTVDGSDPTTSGTRVQYTAPVTLTATTTVKAYAVDSSNNASAVQTVTYTKQVSSTLFSDDFNRADGGIGSNWTYAGTAQVLSNQTGFTANFTSFPNKDVAVSDNISVEMDLILPSLVTGNISGLAVRLPSTSNGQAILFGAKNNGTKLGFLSTLSGTSVLPADVDFTFVAGQSYRLKVEITSNIYKCYVDNVLKFTYTDTNSIGLTNTRYGFCFYNTTVPRGDNFLIKSL